LFGLGGFQLWDGTIQHKWWHLHEIRYHVNIVPYDLVWNGIAVIVLIGAVVFLLRARREADPTAHGASAPPSGVQLADRR